MQTSRFLISGQCHVVRKTKWRPKISVVVWFGEGCLPCPGKVKCRNGYLCREYIWSLESEDRVRSFNRKPICCPVAAKHSTGRLLDSCLSAVLLIIRGTTSIMDHAQIYSWGDLFREFSTNLWEWWIFFVIVSAWLPNNEQKHCVDQNDLYWFLPNDFYNEP